MRHKIKIVSAFFLSQRQSFKKLAIELLSQQSMSISRNFVNSYRTLRHVTLLTSSSDRINITEVLEQIESISRNLSTTSVQRVAEVLSNYTEFVDTFSAAHGVEAIQADPRFNKQMSPYIRRCTNSHIEKIVSFFLNEKSVVNPSLRVCILTILSLNSKLKEGFKVIETSANAGAKLKARDFRALLKYSVDSETTEYVLFYAVSRRVLFTADDLVFFLKRISTVKTAFRILKCMQSMFEFCKPETMDLIQLRNSPFRPHIFHQRLKLSSTSISRGIHLMATCSHCNGQLQRFPFPNHTRVKILQALIDYIGSLGKLNTRLISFIKSIQEKEFDVVLDGANIGFCGLDHKFDAECSIPINERPKQPISHKKSPVRHHLWFEHIEAVVQALKEKHLRAVIMLHSRHVESHRLWDKYHRMVEGWKNEGILFCTDFGVEDDLFWLYSLVYHSSAKKRLMVVTNDLIRDHQFALSSQKDLKRLFDECRVRFKIMPPGTLAILNYPLPFAYFPQFCTETCRWHIPTRSHDHTQWHCCSLI